MMGTVSQSGECGREKLIPPSIIHLHYGIAWACRTNVLRRNLSRGFGLLLAIWKDEVVACFSFLALIKSSKQSEVKAWSQGPKSWNCRRSVFVESSACFPFQKESESEHTCQRMPTKSWNEANKLGFSHPTLSVALEFYATLLHFPGRALLPMCAADQTGDLETGGLRDQKDSEALEWTVLGHQVYSYRRYMIDI